jgi:hypothetical protein
MPSWWSSHWRGILASIGIIKGHPFNPDAPTRAIVDLAAKNAYKTSRVIGFEEAVGGRSYLVYPDRRWLNPIADGTPSNPGGALDLAWNRPAGKYLDLNARIWFFTDYYSISPGMISLFDWQAVQHQTRSLSACGAGLERHGASGDHGGLSVIDRSRCRCSPRIPR